MAERPYKFNNRLGTDAGYNHFRGTVPHFVDAARESIKRERFLDANKDTSALLNPTDRKRMLTVGRTLYARDPVVQGCLNQMAELVTALIQPQSGAEDEKWANEAEDWLYENDRWISIEGASQPMAAIDRLIVLSVIRDGDIGVMLTENAAGDSRIQLIPAHRIGSRENWGGSQQKVKGGQFDGATIIDGVILGPANEALGYRVLGNTEAEDRDYGIKDFRLIFRPFYVGQHRGFSWLGAAALGIQDVHESRRLQLIKQKKVAGKTILEHNETGGPPPGTATIVTEGTEASSSVNATAPIFGEEINAGETTYARAGAGAKWEIAESNTPTTNEQEFSADIIRQAVHAIGWSVDYWLNPTKAGGAQMRVVVDGINQTIDTLRRDIVCTVRKWVDPWRIARAINAGFLPKNNDWLLWEYQFAARRTADRRYDSQVSLDEMRSGILTQSSVCARNGDYWQDVNKQKQREARDRLTRAKELADEFGIPIERALDLLGMTTPSGSTSYTVSTVTQEQGGDGGSKE